MLSLSIFLSVRGVRCIFSMRVFPKHVFVKQIEIPPYITPKNKLMDKSPLCTCLIKQDLEEAADPYEFLDKNYSISGILDNLDKLSPKELKCACCLFGVALQKACKKKRRW